MPTARDALLDCALSALRDRPWAAVRMVEVAGAAGVSRQTLYNEFGSKEGLGRALERREFDRYLAGVESALASAERTGADAGDCFAAAAAWTLLSARGNPLLRALLIGCPENMSGNARPTPAHVVELVRDRAVGALEHGYPKLDLAHIGSVCEAAVRLMISYVVAPSASVDEACLQVSRLVSGLLVRGR